MAKAMVLVDGKPFLEYEIEVLKRGSVNDFVICVGYRRELIRDYFGNGQRWRVDIKYSDDGDKLLGTAGSLKNAANLLSDRFFITYGDAYPILDLKSAEKSFLESGKLALMVVYRNSNQYGRSNTVVNNGLVTFYSKTEHSPGMTYVEFGVTMMQKKVLELIPNEYPVDLEVLYRRIISMKQMAAFEVGQRIYDIGSPEGLAEFRQLVASGKIGLP
jgi:NDP-sugar pyrophosphorylase family protein